MNLLADRAYGLNAASGTEPRYLTESQGCGEKMGYRKRMGCGERMGYRERMECGERIR